MDLRTAIMRGVAAERTRCALTQAELAQRAGLTRSVVSEIETGRRTVSAVELLALCRALDAPLARLLASADRADLDSLGL